MYDRTIICLANSRKPPSGRCIAGKEVGGAQQGQWIRPVSSRAGHEVSEEDRRYENGKRAKLLDIVTIPLDRHFPVGHQLENHVLADEYYWSKESTASWNQVRDFVDLYDADFWQNTESTYHGLNDKICEEVASDMQSSLKLISVPSLEIIVQVEAGYEGRPGKRKVRGHFDYEGNQYLLSVTDPEIEEQYLELENGRYEIDDTILCISLTEVWNEYAFRLIASIITSDRCET
ncbi:MAG TPA: hypothetical protein ENH10_06510 [Bacteroidetes bacterium]|nr:hypothetical protein [Bacteroidota bacterium]HEX04795.1 hypothetical protein [Bacteroidota bacterium]